MMERNWLEAVNYNYYYNNLRMIGGKGAEARDTEGEELSAPRDHLYLSNSGKK